ncbi:MAG: hypothetical protein ACE5JX_13995 [Acidobacteriota bacterium]
MAEYLRRLYVWIIGALALAAAGAAISIILPLGRPDGGQPSLKGLTTTLIERRLWT